MQLFENHEDVEIVTMALPLDRETVAWLGKMSRNDTEAAELVASILQSVREDDEHAHRVLN